MKYKGVDQYRESLVHINRLFIIECFHMIQTINITLTSIE